ncbi:hypothetical protein D3C80_981100 [compost metagenome]
MLFLHQRQAGRDTVQHSANIDVDHLVPLGNFQRLEFRQRHHTGIVDDHIDPAMQLQRKVHKPLHVVSAGDIQCLEVRDSTARVDLATEYFEALGTTRPEHDMRPLAGQQARCRLAYATARARDQNDFFRDIRHDLIPHLSAW